jgi:hypothetical protein
MLAPVLSFKADETDRAESGIFHESTPKPLNINQISYEITQEITTPADVLYV